MNWVIFCTCDVSLIEGPLLAGAAVMVPCVLLAADMDVLILGCLPGFCLLVLADCARNLVSDFFCSLMPEYPEYRVLRLRNTGSSLLGSFSKNSWRARSPCCMHERDN